MRHRNTLGLVATLLAALGGVMLLRPGLPGPREEARGARPLSGAPTTTTFPPDRQAVDAQRVPTAEPRSAQSAGPPPDADKSDDFVQATEELRRRMATYELQFGPHIWGGMQTFDEQVQFDAAIRTAVFRGFQAGLTLEQVQAGLDPLLRWQALPQTLSVGSLPEGTVDGSALPPGLEYDLQTMPDPDRQRPVVLYTSVGTPTGGTLYVFQNSRIEYYAGSYWRQRWDAYSLLTDAAGACTWTGALGGNFASQPPGHFGPGLYLLGALTNSKGVPGAALVEGPERSGHFVYVYSTWFDESRKSWGPTMQFELPGSGGWLYDGGAGTVRVHRDYEEAGELQGTIQTIEFKAPGGEAREKAR